MSSCIMRSEAQEGGLDREVREARVAEVVTEVLGMAWGMVQSGRIRATPGLLR